MDSVGSRHGIIGCALRVGASASHTNIILASKLGFNIAHERNVAFDPMLYIGEVLRCLVEPMDVAIQNHLDVRLGIALMFRLNQRIDSVCGKRIAIQAASNIEDVAFDIGIAFECVFGNTVVNRTCTTCILEEASFLSDRCAR